MTQHPVWLAAFALLGLFLIYISAAGYRGRDRCLSEVLPAGIAGAGLIIATLLDLFGAFA